FADRAGNAGMATRERHRRDLEAAKQAMESAADRLRFFPEQADLLAEDMRQATGFLDRLTGRIDVEDLLDEIFSAFCLGK
ncbi:MAG: tRNA uridine-5-carboxymethylaminomethyl(34) synthesis GTPase MnmE, partial [Mangrovicoccus sp.]|nr:tRNA uridine-5-carboxymethylaminomethyl(34) synthesis GTPase MnmE [Mangrovicoccus sp.]